MKKRSCKMTTEEKTEHEFAVKVRKMTDKQLYEFICDLSEKILLNDLSNNLKVNLMQALVLPQ